MLKQVTGLEPVIIAWEATVIPLHHTCIVMSFGYYMFCRYTIAACDVHYSLVDQGVKLPCVLVATLAIGIMQYATRFVADTRASSCIAL